MKTTLDIDDELLVQAKALAARERKSLTALIEDDLRLRLRARPPAGRRKAVALPIFRGGSGLRPGIDPSSNRSMFDVADDDS